MTIIRRRSRVINPRTDKSGLLRSFQQGIIETVLPGSIEYSKDLADYFGNGVDIRILEVDGRHYTSCWHLDDAIIRNDGRLSEFLVVQGADESFEAGGVGWSVQGFYYLRFYPGHGGWTADRQCVYQWDGGDVDSLEDKHIAMRRKLEVNTYSPYFSRLIYPLAQER